MNFNQSITLNKYSEKATKGFNDMQSRLTKTESSFRSRMNGRSVAGLIATVFGIILWIAVFGAGAYMAFSATPSADAIILPADVYAYVLKGAVAVIAMLMLFMLADSLVNMVYYGRISAYNKAISDLISRVSSGKSSILKNHDRFIASKGKGWNFPLKVASSIPGEAASIESRMSGIESLKTGFINGGKNFFYFTSVIVVTVVGSLALFPLAIEIVGEITDGYIDDNVIRIICIVAAVLACIIEILLAKRTWERTNLNVTPVTLLIILLAPVLFALIIAVGSLVVALVMLVVSVILYLLGIVVALAVAYSCLCGG